MKLRIIAGELKRRKIELSGASADFRPTKEMVRKSVSDFLAPWIRGAVVADICSGSGAFGFEMLSRGAQEVHFVEELRERCKHLNEYAQKFGVVSKCKVIRQDVSLFYSGRQETYDIVYYDPPYVSLPLAALVPHLLQCITADGILLYERRKGRPGYGTIPDSFCLETRRYGDTEVDIFTHARMHSPEPGGV